MKSYDKQLNNWVKSKKLSKATNIVDDIVNDNDIIYDDDLVHNNNVIDVRDEEATVVAEAINEEIGTGTVPNKIEHDFVNGERNGDAVVDIINETKPFDDVIIDSLKDGEETTTFHSTNQTNNAETTLINQISNVGDSVGDTLRNNGDNADDNENNCANSAIVFGNNNRTVDENNQASEDIENNHDTIAIVFINQATPIDETIEIDENLPSIASPTPIDIDEDDFVDCGDCCDGDDSEINTAYNDDINNDNSGALDDVEKQSDDNIVDVANGSNNSFVNTEMKSSDNNNDNDRDNGYRINIVTNNRDRLARVMNNTYDVTPHVVTPTPNSNNNVNCHVDSHDHDVDCHEDSYDHDTHDCMDDPIGNNRSSYCHFVSKKGDDDEHTVERLLINDDYLVSDDEFETPRQANERGLVSPVIPHDIEFDANARTIYYVNDEEFAGSTTNASLDEFSFDEFSFDDEIHNDVVNVSIAYYDDTEVSHVLDNYGYGDNRNDCNDYDSDEFGNNNLQNLYELSLSLDKFSIEEIIFDISNYGENAPHCSDKDNRAHVVIVPLISDGHNGNVNEDVTSALTNDGVDDYATNDVSIDAILYEEITYDNDIFSDNDDSAAFDDPRSSSDDDGDEDNDDNDGKNNNDYKLSTGLVHLMKLCDVDQENDDPIHNDFISALQLLGCHDVRSFLLLKYDDVSLETSIIDLYVAWNISKTIEYTWMYTRYRFAANQVDDEASISQWDRDAFEQFIYDQ